MKYSSVSLTRLTNKYIGKKNLKEVKKKLNY